MHTNRTARVRVALCLLLAFAAAPALAGPAAAQGTQPLAAKAAEILARFPADAADVRNQLAARMLALGEPGLAEFTRQLVPAGTGNDIAVRWALNAMAVHASRAGAEAERALAERALVKALAGTPDTEVRTFLLSQLRIVGRERAVKAATPYLADPALVEPATQLMLSVRSLSAKAALAAALDTAAGPAQATIVKALGDLRVAEAHDRLLTLAASPDPTVRRSALAALARIASPRSYATMTEAAKAVEFKYEPGNAVGALMEYARQLGRKGALVTSEKVCRFVIANVDDDERMPTKTAALAILVDIRGPLALPDLLKAVEHANAEYRRAALQYAERLRGPEAVRQWVAKAKTTDAARQAEIVAMLGRQGDRRALPFIRASLASPEPELMLAAARALAQVERAKAVPDLLPLMKTATGDTVARLSEILLWTIDEKHLDPLAAMLDSLQPPAKAAAITVIGAKGGRRFAGKIVPLTSDTTPEIRTAAFAALAGVATPGDLPTLFTLLDAADSGTTAPVQRAIVAAANQITPEAERAAPLVQAIKASSHPDRIVELLPQVGGPAALAEAIAQFGSPSADQKAAAFRALSRWPGVEAADRLFTIFASGDETFRNQAFSAFVRQISSSTLTPEQKVLQLRKALAKASTVGDRRILIRAFERIKTFGSFLMVAPLLDDAEVANEAAGAVSRIALQTPGTKDGLAGTLVRDALTKAIPALKGQQAESDKEAIRSYLAAMPQEEGFVPLFNGKDLAGWKGLVENPLARAKMSAADLAAKQAEADAKAKANWTVREGTIVFNGTGDNLCTVKDYGDFELLVDWRITKGGDSGVYLRGTPQVQIWDTARVDVGAQVGSGGLYNNQKHPSKPLVVADNPVGEWNTLRITMVGEKVTVFLNGIKVVDNVTMENYWDRKLPIFPRGAIELQAHGTDLAFRDIYVREIK